MSDLDSLDSETRARVLVGIFLQNWAAMELALRDAIGAALNIESVQMQILAANIRFRDKLDILRTLVDVSALADDEKSRAKRQLRKLGKHSTRRNMIAHDPFLADPSGNGVQFVTVKAKGEFGTPIEVWLPNRFEHEDKAIKGHTEFLESLGKRFKTKPLTPQNYADALRPFL